MWGGTKCLSFAIRRTVLLIFKPIYSIWIFQERLESINILSYYMSLSHKVGNYQIYESNLIGWNRYWPRARFSHLDRSCFPVKKLQTKMQNRWRFHLTVFIAVSAKKLMRKKKSKEDEQTLEELNSAHRHSQLKCQLVQNCSCLCNIINILLTDLSRSL